MDTGGKDGVIHRVFQDVNPQGVRVAHFGVPTPEEKDHDFLWRIHKQVPGNEELVIFNRSQYESVLVERVHDCQGYLFCPETHLAVGKMRMLREGILFKHSQLALNAMRWTNCNAEAHILLDGHCRHYS